MNADDTGWVRAAARSDLAPGDVFGVEVSGHSIALYEVDGSIFATDNICTHAYACLSDGYLEDGIIECPLHAGRFEVKTGKALGAPVTVDIAVFAVKLEGDDVLVKLG